MNRSGPAVNPDLGKELARVGGLTNSPPESTLPTMWSRLVALILVLAMWPAAGETVELVAHVAEHGDLAHGADDEHDSMPLGDREHGCSSTFHLCGAAYHIPMRIAAAPSEVQPPSPAGNRSELPAPAHPLGLDAPAPIIRPPIA